MALVHPVITKPRRFLSFSKSFCLNLSQRQTIWIDESVHCSVYSPTKRSMDIIGSLVGLAITAILWLPIAIAIQWDNPGPIFYRQWRCGIRGKPFSIWKFRSMIVGAERQQHLIKNQAKGHIFKNKHDPRITRIGKFLRRTSLDEFPQFWNVLIGDMSLVGTRPPTLQEVKKYNSYHFRRLRVKPGLTGEWQVKGRSQLLNFEEIIRMDLDYQHHWSILYDLYLILRTIRVVLNGRGAY